MTSQELRNKFLKFFEERGHKTLPSSSLIPAEIDPSVLFTTAGMHPFKRYYAEPEVAPAPTIATSQKCIRTGDIEEVGDATHLTFFEMLGNFSFGYPSNEGSYFKNEAIQFAWDFLTSELGFEVSRIHTTYFKGEDDIPADTESYELIKSITKLPEDKIIGTGKDETFWSLGTENSPGGPTVEFYIDGIEIWNLVFNEYLLKNGKYEPSQFKGVDTGMGFERLVAVLDNKNDVYKTDLFSLIIAKIEEISDEKYEENIRAFRVIADHLKTATFLSAERLTPSNLGQGYVMRRLIRRAIRYGWNLNMKTIIPVMNVIIDIYKNIYPELGSDQTVIQRILNEEEQFQKTIQEGLKKVAEVFTRKKPINEEEYHKIMQLEEKGHILGDIYARGGTGDEVLQKLGIDVDNKKIMSAYVDGEEAFYLYQSFGFPIEMIIELAQEKRMFIDIRGYRAELQKHQELSRTASAGMFKGGLADSSEETTKLHTAAHLLLAALRKVLGDHVTQKGSNITAERLRFDFSHPEKLSPEQIAEVEKLVNEAIEKKAAVTMEEMSIAEAKKSGAHGVFDERYGDKVKVFTITDTSSGEAISKEICGGPHVTNTGELGKFKIIKEESSSAGVRRIKAILQ